MAFSSANPASLAETTSTLVFPVEGGIASEIPLWMKFFCFEFPNTAAGRAIATSRSQGGAGGSIPLLPFSNLKAQIHIPAPVSFETTTANVYANQVNQGYNMVPPSLGGGIEKLFELLPKGGAIIEGTKAIRDAIDIATDAVNEFVGNWAGYGSDIPFDNSDAVYVPSGPTRVFEIKLFFPCLSENDSVAAGKIVRAFEALSLPTIQSTFSLSTATLFHPPVWIFGIGKAGSMKMDIDWSGQPQLSVLQTVKTKKTAFDTNSLAAIGTGFKPVGYVVSLVFKELEPAIRLPGFGETSTFITNRSGAVTTSALGVGFSVS